MGSTDKYFWPNIRDLGLLMMTGAVSSFPTFSLYKSFTFFVGHGVESKAIHFILESALVSLPPI